MNLESLSLEHASTLVDEHVENNVNSVTETNDPKICDIINVAIPILQFVKKILFFKPKWKLGIDVLVKFLQTLCPDQTQTLSNTKPLKTTL